MGKYRRAQEPTMLSLDDSGDRKLAASSSKAQQDAVVGSLGNEAAIVFAGLVLAMQQAQARRGEGGLH
ncbi:hypothetical protein C4D60_Mb08t16740 [Musa balbisiana]|uniref:Uncharacterized protein n=1 Tax=Musa balbisiana TaxID=52838 RepID=A0A4S8K4A7_MUSBA|nr:hypothetical protein C4D60_Mb08t16740 [Musa balbisiana]